MTLEQFQALELWIYAAARALQTGLPEDDALLERRRQDAKDALVSENDNLTLEDVSRAMYESWVRVSEELSIRRKIVQWIRRKCSRKERHSR